MKTLITFAACIMMAASAAAQSQELSRDEEGNRVIIGFLSKQQLSTDTSFAWFNNNRQGYTPDPNALQALKANRDSISFVVFGGTWCGDTKHVLPQFFSLTEAAGFPQDRITLIGVDHKKNTIQNLSHAFGITNVPTIIVMKNGKEIGRVIEYGHSGLFDKDLGEVIGK